MLMTSKTIKLFAAFILALSLSACATSGSGGLQYPMDKVTSAIGSAGSRVWDGTRQLFKLKDRSAAEKAEQPDEFLDEVDLALLEDGEYNEQLENELTAELYNPELDAGNDTTQMATVDILVSEDEKEPAQPAQVADLNTTGPEDLFHTVGDNETLWELAKLLTGDATNWTVLASVNNLDDNGTVYAGQKIRVPASLKRLPLDSDVVETNIAASTDETAAKANVVVAKAATAAPAQAGTAYTVEAGETLWDLSGRSTGNPSNWKIIADFNNLDERAASNIRYGQTINVPSRLVKGDAQQPAPAIAAAKKRLEVPTKQAAEVVAKVVAPKNEPKAVLANNTVASVTPVQNNSPQAAGSTEVAVAAVPAAEAATKLVTVDANFKADPPALPSAKAADALSQDSRKKRNEIMVSGTYYPKAIYNDANFSSSLLMRVSPGTKLKISRTVGPWYEVVTDRGIGFVHSRDTK